MKSKALLSFVTCSLLLLSGCQSAVDIDVTAQCLANAAPATLAQKLGLEFGRTGKVDVAELPAGSCSVGSFWTMRTELRREISQKLPELLVARAEFRGGAYGAILNGDATPAQTDAVSKLGLKLEAFANAREAGMNCLSAPKALLDVLDSTDVVFATAALGVSGGVPNATAAQALAVELVDRARAAAPMSQDPSCEQPRENEFRAYAEEVQLFMEGKHPLAKGCSAQLNDDGLSLSCG